MCTLGSGGTAFTYSKRRKSVHKIQPFAMHGSPVARRPPPQPMQVIPQYGIPQCRRTQAFPHRIRNTENWELAQGPWPPILSRTKKYTLSIKQGRIFPHKAISPAKAVRGSLSLGKEVFQGPRPALMWPRGGWKTACTGWPFPTAGQYWLRPSPWGSIRHWLGLQSPEQGWRTCS